MRNMIAKELRGNPHYSSKRIEGKRKYDAEDDIDLNNVHEYMEEDDD